MCVLCSEFSCRVGNNHQIQRKKREDELAQQTFLFFTFFRCIIPSLRPDIDAINGQDDVYLEFVPILDIYYSCNAIKFISFDPLQPTIPCQTEMSCHHFPNWLAIYQWLSIFHQSTGTKKMRTFRVSIQNIRICFLKEIGVSKTFAIEKS